MTSGPWRDRLTTSRGQCRPLGATPRPGGVNFAVFSRHAAGVTLVLFADGQEEPAAEIPLSPDGNRTGDVWHVFVHHLPAGALYAYRVNGPFAPLDGHRFNPRALLLDPYARSIATRRDGRSRLGRAAGEDFDWEDDRPPRTPLEQTVVYEAHVRGYTKHPSSGVGKPGTYLGLIEKLPHLKALGVTALRLLPIHEFDELDGHGGPAQRNFWGYSTLGYFAPKASYATRPGQEQRELKELVKQCHRAGIEVILDVVYNHTAEGNENGPTLSFRGLDNSVYYLLDETGRNVNYSGCGNTVNCNHPVVRQLILDSLAEMVAEYHVDGFRFDLGAVFAQLDGEPLDDPPLVQEIAEHPILAGCKLFTEAWDANGLYLVGQFPRWGRWAEFNGPFRDDVRRFVKGEANATADLAKRIGGSLDLYGETATHPYHSINYVTCHDGFTLNDLVSYEKKHNEANGEGNRDGWDDNKSFNCGVEGPTNDPTILELRQRQMRNLLTLLFLSQGVPFLLAGDEMGRTQKGNNNAYCQDNEISWVDWSLLKQYAGLVRFTAMLIALRKKYFALSREAFLERSRWHGARPGEPDWTGTSRCLALHLSGQPHFYLMLNSHTESRRFALPAIEGRWRRLLDTHLPSPDDLVEEKNAVPLSPSDHYVVSPRSSVLLMS